MAQPGRALAWGARGREFKSPRPDHLLESTTYWKCPSSENQTRGFNLARFFAPSFICHLERRQHLDDGEPKWIFAVGGKSAIFPTSSLSLLKAMEEPLFKNLDLNGLSVGMPGLTPTCGKFLAESAAVCLEDRGHKQGVSLKLTGLKKQEHALIWLKVTDQQRRCYNDLQEATQFGACGLAILVVKEVTGLVVVDRSRKGPGFDYWLGEGEDDVLFDNKARLEVSGILSGSASEVRGRTSQKNKQIKPSAALATGYVAIIEFSKPTAHLEVGT